MAIPHLAQLIGRDGDGREGGGRLGLEEAEALAQLVRDQVAERDVVGEHDEADGFLRALRGWPRCASSPR